MRFLSLAGRLILVQAVLSQMAIYWAHLFFLPLSISKKMTSLAANFLWGGRSHQSKIHLAKMDLITRPKKKGGWGLLHMNSFGKALLCKSLIRGIYGKSLWSNIINQKYLKGRSMVYWFRRKSLGIRSGSFIWKSFRKLQSFFLGNLKWTLSFGSYVFIGLDPTLHKLELLIPPDLLLFFLSKGLFTWNKLIHSWISQTPVWKNADDLSIPLPLRPLWDSAVNSFTSKGSLQSSCADELIWSLEKPAHLITVKDLYAALSLGLPPPSPSFPPIFWKASCPLKMILFSWLLFSNRNLSWEVLQRKGWQGPGRCQMCRNDAESNLHMFFQCGASSSIWYDLSLIYGFSHRVFSSVQDGFLWWSAQCPSWRSLFIITCWFLWKWRNEHTFQNSCLPLESILIKISGYMPPVD